MASRKRADRPAVKTPASLPGVSARVRSKRARNVHRWGTAAFVFAVGVGSLVVITGLAFSAPSTAVASLLQQNASQTARQGASAFDAMLSPRAKELTDLATAAHAARSLPKEGEKIQNDDIGRAMQTTENDTAVVAAILIDKQGSVVKEAYPSGSVIPTDPPRWWLDSANAHPSLIAAASVLLPTFKGVTIAMATPVGPAATATEYMIIEVQSTTFDRLIKDFSPSGSMTTALVTASGKVLVGANREVGAPSKQAGGQAQKCPDPNATSPVDAGVAAAQSDGGYLAGQCLADLPFAVQTKVLPTVQQDATASIRQGILVVSTFLAGLFFIGFLIQLRSIKQLYAAEDALREQATELQHAATHDALTALPNRVLFHDRLQQALLTARRAQKPVAILLLDLNLFKQVNDQLGHDAGDQLLREIGRRLKHCLRESDTVARLGGDEFAVVAPDTDMRGATEVIQKIENELAPPAAIAGQNIPIGVAIGVAIFPDHGYDDKALLRRADSEMYAAKRRRKRREGPEAAPVTARPAAGAAPLTTPDYPAPRTQAAAGAVTPRMTVMPRSRPVPAPGPPSFAPPPQTPLPTVLPAVPTAAPAQRVPASPTPGVPPSASGAVAPGPLRFNRPPAEVAPLIRNQPPPTPPVIRQPGAPVFFAVPQAPVPVAAPTSGTAAPRNGRPPEAQVGGNVLPYPAAASRPNASDAPASDEDRSAAW